MIRIDQQVCPILGQEIYHPACFPTLPALLAPDDLIRCIQSDKDTPESVTQPKAVKRELENRQGGRSPGFVSSGLEYRSCGIPSVWAITAFEGSSCCPDTAHGHSGGSDHSLWGRRAAVCPLPLFLCRLAEIW